MKHNTTSGGGRYVLRLVFLIIISLIMLRIDAQENIYQGFIDHFDYNPNLSFILYSDGTIFLDRLFSEGEFQFSINPQGIVSIAGDRDWDVNKNLKWYVIQEDRKTFIESPDQLPTPYPTTIVWTETPFRVILGCYPNRVWQLNPLTLKAQLLSEYMDIEAIGTYATYAPELHYIFMSGPDYKIRRVRYDDHTATISGPVTIFPIPFWGNVDMTQTSDGRLIILLSTSIGGNLAIFHVENDGSLTITQQGEHFEMGSVRKAIVSPDDKYLFIIACDGNNINSFHLTPEGTVTPISQLQGFGLAQAGALTPDGKFLVATHHYYSSYPRAIMSVFAVGEDGSLTHLPDKDIPLSNTVWDIVFFPPQQWPTTARTSWENYY